MARNYGVGALRTIGFVYGIVSLSGGVAIFVLFVGLPSRLPYLLPPWLGRPILEYAPWLVATPGSTTSELASLLGSLAFVGYGLWSLGKALTASDNSLAPTIGGGGEGGED